MPITRRKDDLRFLSLVTTENEVGVRLIDFAKENPAFGDLKLKMNKSEVNLHRSWASRPVLVLETRGSNPKTRLVFSRGEIAIDYRKPVESEPTTDEQPYQRFDTTKPKTESLGLETLVFERDASPTDSDAPFEKVSGAACRVKYTFRSHEQFPCYRKFESQRPMRASPAAKMQASQLLVGHFAGRDGYGVAFPDFCMPADPIILKQKGETLVPEKFAVGNAGTFTRHVSCDPLDLNAYVSGPIKSTPDTTISAADWPWRPHP